MIQLTEHLTAANLNALEQLAELCKQHDGNRIALYKDLLANNRPKPSSVLLFQDDILIGFAAAFFFEFDTAEISLLIHPAYRQQGHAKTCLNILLKNIETHRPIPNLSFSIPHGLQEKALQTQGLKYQSSEYEMKYDLSLKQKRIIDFSALQIRKAIPEDMATFCELDQRCFPSANPYSEFRFTTLLAREQHAIFILLQENKIIGKAHVTWDEQSAFLSDIAIFPEMQGQGYGTKIIAYCIDFAHKLPQNNIRLSVETHNKNALNLYSHIGFKITNAIDYWNCPYTTLKPRKSS